MIQKALRQHLRDSRTKESSADGSKEIILGSLCINHTQNLVHEGRKGRSQSPMPAYKAREKEEDAVDIRDIKQMRASPEDSKDNCPDVTTP